MSIKTTILDKEKIAIIEPKGSLIGGEETDELKNTVNTIRQNGNTKLIIDLKKVTYLNSTALQIFNTIRTDYEKNNGKIVLCNVSKNINNIFVITKLTEYFTIVDTKDEAQKNIAK